MYKMFSYCLSHHLWRIKAVRAALDRLFSLHFMLLGSAEGSHDGSEVEVLELCWHAANSQSWRITFPYSSGRSGTLSKQRDSITLPSSAYTSIPESISSWGLCVTFGESVRLRNILLVMLLANHSAKTCTILC